MKHPILYISNNIADKLIISDTFLSLKQKPLYNMAPVYQKIVSFIDSLEMADKPCVILLDLNGNSKNELELLSSIKSHHLYGYIPVVIINHNKQQLIQSYNVGVAGYFLKPRSNEEWTNLISLLYQYWKTCERVVNSDDIYY